MRLGDARQGGSVDAVARRAAFLTQRLERNVTAEGGEHHMQARRPALHRFDLKRGRDAPPTSFEAREETRPG